MQEAKKEALDRIVVKDNKLMKQIIDWYIKNQDYIEKQPFFIPFKQALVCLKEENIEFSFEVIASNEILFKIYMMPGDKDVLICAFTYDPEKDQITERRFPSNIPPARLNTMRIVLDNDKTCQKEAFKFRVLMYYAVFYENDVEIDPKQEKRLDKHIRKTLKKKGGGPIPLVRNTYVVKVDSENLKRPADPDKKRHYEKPNHEIRVRGYRRKNGTWVAPYSRYKDKNSDGPKTYKA